MESKEKKRITKGGNSVVMLAHFAPKLLKGGETTVEGDDCDWCHEPNTIGITWNGESCRDISGTEVPLKKGKILTNTTPLKSALRNKELPRETRRVVINSVQENVGANNANSAPSWVTSTCAKMVVRPAGIPCGYLVKVLPPGARAPVTEPWQAGSGMAMGKEGSAEGTRQLQFELMGRPTEE